MPPQPVESELLQQAHSEHLLGTMPSPLSGYALQYARLVVGDYFGRPRGEWVTPIERNELLSERGMVVNTATAQREFGQIRDVYERALARFIETSGLNRRLNPKQLETLRNVNPREIALIAARLKRQSLALSLNLSDEQFLAIYPVPDPFDLPFFRRAKAKASRHPKPPAPAPAPKPEALAPDPAPPAPEPEPIPQGDPVSPNMIGVHCRLTAKGAADPKFSRLSFSRFKIIEIG